MHKLMHTLVLDCSFTPSPPSLFCPELIADGIQIYSSLILHLSMKKRLTTGSFCINVFGCNLR